MEFLSKQEKAGYFPASKLDWVKNVLNATQGLDENGAKILSEYSWADSNAPAAELKKAVDEALARNTADPKQTSHNFIYGQHSALPFTAADVEWSNVADAGLIHQEPLKVGKKYKGIVVFVFKKKDGTDFFARMFEVDVKYDQIKKDDEDGKPHQFIFGNEVSFYGSDGNVVANYRGFHAADDGLAGL
jgi:hypothetical protein